ncbi:transmembrane protein 214 isoform X3 [Ailuropoda melanoleuca]|uniref:transmembrane protein 214 isoform X3 n=1 Tax=Ailuropoda melanoleuca TaxID=9646 RepID=UPI0014945E04|nr:transmembrane protein 214 isoform X3 [Ailuropoda melanoleuca]
MAAKAAGGGRWEVVKKGRRPGAGGSGRSGGADRRALGEANGVWKYDLTPPIQTTSTLYERGFERILKRQNKEQVPPPAAEPKKPGSKKQTKKVATLTNQNQKQGRFRSLEEALKALDIAALQKELDKSQSVFSGNPSVWLKDLASYLNYKLQAPLSEPTLSQHTHDYPYSLVSRELRGIIRGLLAKAAGSLELFFDHCLFTMLQELDKTPGESLHGYRICIQAVLQDKPKIATMNLGKFLELLRSHQSRPAKCLTIMWALGQAGFTNLTEGLKVWLGIMLPVLGIKSLSPFAIAYLDRLLLMHPNLTKGFGMIGPKDFFPLLDFAYMPNNSLTPSLQEQLCQLYPRLKVLAFGAKPESTLHTYFPSFLSRATPSCPPEMKKELLSSLTECLTVDPLSASVWRQLYPKHLAQSRQPAAGAPAQVLGADSQEDAEVLARNHPVLQAYHPGAAKEGQLQPGGCHHLRHRLQGPVAPGTGLPAAVDTATPVGADLCRRFPVPRLPVTQLFPGFPFWSVASIIWVLARWPASVCHDLLLQPAGLQLARGDIASLGLPPADRGEARFAAGLGLHQCHSQLSFCPLCLPPCVVW